MHITLRYLIVVIAFVCASTPLAAAQGTGSPQEPLWEALQWGSHHDQVFTALTARGVVISSQKWTPGVGGWLECYEGPLRTTLTFSKGDLLEKIALHSDFSVVEKEESKAHYDEVMQELVALYGPPVTLVDDTAKEIVTATWSTTYTKLTLVYDYKYKIIDELGCCSYSVDVIAVPR